MLRKLDHTLAIMSSMFNRYWEPDDDAEKYMLYTLKLIGLVERVWDEIDDRDCWSAKPELVRLAFRSEKILSTARYAVCNMKDGDDLDDFFADLDPVAEQDSKMQRGNSGADHEFERESPEPGYFSARNESHPAKEAAKQEDETR